MKERLYRNYLLAVLAILLAFNGANNIFLGVVLQDVKSAFSLTDTQLGLLTGIAFALFYSFMGVPISRWADRGNRVVIISITTILWSAAVALCAVARTFDQLLAIRVCMAVGEAGCLPLALPLIADHFSRAERPRAVALYLQGSSLSVLLGYFLAGWLNQFYGWRWTFIALALPGLVLAPLVWLTLREPRKAQAYTVHADGPGGASALRIQSPQEPPRVNPGLKEVCRTLWANRTFRHLLLFYSVSSFFSQGIAQWQPALLIRSYGLKSGELGTWMAGIYGFGLMAGTYLSGEWAARRAANNERLLFRAMALAFCALGVFASLVYLSPNRYWAFGWMVLWSLASSVTSAPLLATIQSLVPERMRATTMTLMLFAGNLIGLGLGPLAAGALSDALRSWAGKESLRYALLALCPGYLWGGWYLWQASKTIMTDLENLRARQGAAREQGIAPDASSRRLANTNAHQPAPAVAPQTVKSRRRK